ncbi:BRCA1-associated RING domain protein 1 [Pristis pectinata]|uniref:BRCA1-associated RING domain protein 1 n=1 Tax=Pristis pectinata TaxID=685728 RepID=UPI00223CAF3C|nr:BRCA1-associated RING domain protein 1 [Pristis pectinata]
MSESEPGPGFGPVTGLTPAWARTGEALAALQRMLQCSGCCKLLQEPVCLGSCDHVFCRVCVADSLGNGCPVCHAPAWVKDLQPNRQLHNIVHLCSQLQALLNNKGSPADKSNPVTPEMRAERQTGKKWQIRTWFSPRSRKLKCVLDMNALKKDQKINPSSDLNGTSSSMFEFLSSPSPPHGSPKKKTSDKSKQGVRKRLTDANKDWGFGKRTSKEIKSDSPGKKDHDRVVSFSSQPMVFSSQKQAIAGEPAEELVHSDAVSQTDNVINSNVESVSKNLGGNLSDGCPKAAASSCKDISLGQLAQIFEKEEHLVPLPTAHASAKRSRKSSGSSSKTPSKKVRKGQSSCIKILTMRSSKNVCEPTGSDTHQESAAPLLLKSELNESVNETRATSSTENSCNTPSNRGNSERKQHATQKQPRTPQSTPKSHLAGSCATIPISPFTPSMKRNHKGETPLHIASIKGDIAAVEQLLENGANPNIKDNAGWTPLHEACNHGHVKVVQKLLQFGVLVNTPGYENDSPLHDAVKNRHVDVVKLLVLHGASQDVINIFGLRPIDYANSEELIAALKHSTKDENPVVEQCFVASASQRRDEPIMLLGSGLLPADKKKLDKLIKLLKVGHCTEFSSSVTHIIVPSDHAPCTMKCLMGIISGCWFVDLQWVTACLECKDRVSEEDYEINSMTGPKRGRLNRVQQLPKLFDGCHFYFMGSFKSCKKEDLVHLAKLGGGQVLARQPKPDSDVTQSINTVAYHASPGSDQSFCTQYIIYDKDSNYKPEKIRLGKVWTTHSAWLINCVKSFELLPVTEN